MNKRAGFALSAVFLIFFVFIPIFTQLTKPEPRVFQTVHFLDSIYDEVSFENFREDLRLAGMLFLPEGNGPFPAAVIIHGSGTSDRDNLWPLTLTQYLRESGIAVLLPDKRGSEKSEGDWRTSSFQDLAGDTLAAISFLKDHDKIEVSQIGVIGISQGGHIAPIVGSQSPDIAFLVNVVGGSIRMHELLLYEENGFAQKVLN